MALRYLGADKFDDPLIFMGLFTSISPYTMHATAHEGHPGGGSVTESLCR